MVCCEFAREKGDDLFAATPPLESLRTANSLAATSIEGMQKNIRYPENELRIQISFIDIDRPYFCAETNLEVVTYVKLPMKDPDHGRMCCLLLKHIYTAHEEQRMFGAASMPTYLRKRSSSRQATPPLVSLKQNDAPCMEVTFTTICNKLDLDWLKVELSKKYELKELQRLGPGATDDK